MTISIGKVVRCSSTLSIVRRNHFSKLYVVTATLTKGLTDAVEFCPVFVMLLTLHRISSTTPKNRSCLRRRTTYIAKSAIKYRDRMTNYAPDRVGSAGTTCR